MNFIHTINVAQRRDEVGDGALAAYHHGEANGILARRVLLVRLRNAVHRKPKIRAAYKDAA